MLFYARIPRNSTLSLDNPCVNGNMLHDIRDRAGAKPAKTITQGGSYGKKDYPDTLEWKDDAIEMEVVG